MIGQYTFDIAGQVTITHTRATERTAPLVQYDFETLLADRRNLDAWGDVTPDYQYGECAECGEFGNLNDWNLHEGCEDSLHA